MKEHIGTINPNDHRRIGHQEHITGTGVHDKKRYNRKQKHKGRPDYEKTT